MSAKQMLRNLLLALALASAAAPVLAAEIARMEMRVEGMT
jgi:hypothetical protein